MSRVDVEYGLEEILTSKDNTFVLFYASWCPFSQRFLPVFDSFSRDRTRKCMRIVIDDKASLCEKYSVDVVPTVLLLRKEKSRNDWTECQEKDSQRNNSLISPNLTDERGPWTSVL